MIEEENNNAHSQSNNEASHITPEPSLLDPLKPWRDQITIHHLDFIGSVARLFAMWQTSPQTETDIVTFLATLDRLSTAYDAVKTERTEATVATPSKQFLKPNNFEALVTATEASLTKATEPLFPNPTIASGVNEISQILQILSNNQPDRKPISLYQITQLLHESSQIEYNTLLAQATHDLVLPLTTLRGYAGFIISTTNGQATLKPDTDVHISIPKLKNLITQSGKTIQLILPECLSTLAGERLPQQIPSNILIQTLISTINRTSEVFLPHIDLIIDVDDPDDLKDLKHHTITWSLGHLEALIATIFSNSQKAFRLKQLQDNLHSPNKLRVTAHTSADETGQQYLSLEFSDTAQIGFPHEMLAQGLGLQKSGFAANGEKGTGKGLFYASLQLQKYNPNHQILTTNTFDDDKNLIGAKTTIMLALEGQTLLSR